jgi:hypothetical protein
MTILICTDELHAEIMSELIGAYIREKDGNPGTWSSVYVKPGLLSDTYGILWEPVCAEVLGDPATLPIVEAEDGEWSVLMPEPETGSAT